MKFLTLINKRSILNSNIVFTAIGLFVIATIIFFFLYTRIQLETIDISKAEYSITSVLNLNEYDVTTNINSVGTILKIYDMESLEFDKDAIVDFSIVNPQDYELNRVLGDSVGPRLYLFVLQKDNPYCYFSANVTNIYYSATQEISEVKILTNEAKQFIEVPLNWFENNYIYPGNYHLGKLPESITDKDTIGVYPIRCSDLATPEKFKETVLFYKDFDPLKQREFYEAEKVRLSQ